MRHDMIWQRSSFCKLEGLCAEVNMSGEMVFIRNSTSPNRIVAFDKNEWDALVKGIKNDEF